MNIIVLTILTILFVWLLNRWRTRAYVRLAYQFPSNRLQTLLGWGPVITIKDALAYFFNYAEKYGPESVFWSGPFSIFLLSKPETVEDVLKARNCIDKPMLIYEGLEFILGSGLTILSDPTWSRRRKIFNKVFSNTNLISYTPNFRDEIIKTINTIEENLKSGKSFDMLLLFQTLTVRTSFKAILKRDFECTGYNDTEIARQTSRAQRYAAERTSNLILKVKFFRYLADFTIYRGAKKANDKFHNYIIESIHNSINDSSYLPDIVSPVDIGFAATKQNILSLKEMEVDIKHLYGGAFETSSTTLFLVICMLAMHHECQQRVYDEIVSLLPDFGNNDKITFDQVNQLVYLDMVVNETMRVFPLVPMVFRSVTNENLKLRNGQILPIGQMICIDIYRLHRNKDIWGPEADRFNPENFSPTNIKQRHPYAFIPFTKGQRLCIGYRFALLFLKISLAELIRRFQFDTDFKYEDLKIENNLTIHLVEEPKIKIERRVCVQT